MGKTKKKKKQKHLRGGLSMQDTAHPKRELAAMLATEDGEITAVLYNTDVRIIGTLMLVYGLPDNPMKGSKIPWWFLPREACHILKESVNISSQGNVCLYTASREYLAAWFGRTLNPSDKTWFSDHPLATKDGIPLEHTLRVLHELLQPYEVGIKRVILPQGVSLAEELKPWLVQLGCNPLAMVDRTTTNAAFAEQSGMDVASVNKLFRFEFSTERVRPSICCGQFAVQYYDHKKGTVVSTMPSGGGHAEFVGVREQGPSSPYLQVQLDWADRLPPVAITFSKLAKAKSEWQYRLVPWQCKAPDGRTISQVEISAEDKVLECAKDFFKLYGGKPEEHYFRPYGSRTPLSTQPVHVPQSVTARPQVKGGLYPCKLCGDYWPVDKRWATGMCLNCARTEIYGGFQCHDHKKCKTDWKQEPPIFYSITKNKDGSFLVSLKCRTCKSVSTITGWSDAFVRLYETVTGVQTMPAQDTLWNQAAH